MKPRSAPPSNVTTYELQQSWWPPGGLIPLNKWNSQGKDTLSMAPDLAKLSGCFSGIGPRLSVVSMAFGRQVEQALESVMRY